MTFAIDLAKLLPFIAGTLEASTDLFSSVIQQYESWIGSVNTLPALPVMTQRLTGHRDTVVTLRKQIFDIMEADSDQLAPMLSRFEELIGGYEHLSKDQKQKYSENVSKMNTDAGQAEVAVQKSVKVYLNYHIDILEDLVVRAHRLKKLFPG